MRAALGHTLKIGLSDFPRGVRAVRASVLGDFFSPFFVLHFSFVCNNFFLSFSACTKCVLKDLRDGGGG